MLSHCTLSFNSEGEPSLTKSIEDKITNIKLNTEVSIYEECEKTSSQIAGDSQVSDSLLLSIFWSSFPEMFTLTSFLIATWLPSLPGTLHGCLWSLCEQGPTQVRVPEPRASAFWKMAFAPTCPQPFPGLAPPLQGLSFHICFSEGLPCPPGWRRPSHFVGPHHKTDDNTAGG